MLRLLVILVGREGFSMAVPARVALPGVVD
jgi:hypothetical protein